MKLIQRWFGRALRSAYHQKVIIANEERKRLVAILISDKRVRVEMRKSDGEGIIDHKVFGSEEDKVAALTQDGWILLFKMDLRVLSASLIHKTKLDLFSYNHEIAASLLICPASRFFLVHFRDERKQATRIILYEYKNLALVEKNMKFLYKKELGYFCSSEFYGYFDNFLLFGCFSRCSSPSSWLTYGYDVARNMVYELSGLTREFTADNPMKMVRLSDGTGGLVSSDCNGRVFMVSYSV